MQNQKSIIIEIVNKLKSAREAKGYSILDVSSNLKMNQKYLEELEQGILPNIPLPYVRAFIREYALLVGLNPDYLLQLFEGSANLQTSIPIEETAESSWDEVLKKNYKNSKSIFQKRSVIFVSMVILFAGFLLIVLKYLQIERSPKEIQEITFSDVIKEWENKTQDISNRKDSLAKSPEYTKQPGIDSLTLEAVTSETVWIRISIDHGVAKEYTLNPNDRLKWKAKDEYYISIGNPGGITLFLNGREIALPRKNRTPIWNFKISRDIFR